MGYYSEGSPQHQQESHVPSAFFDGIELGVEATMFTILVAAIPAGAQVGLSATLGYATRYTDGMAVDPKAFSLFGFLFAWLLAFLAIALALFAFSAIPMLLYNGVLVAIMLRLLRRRREHLKRASIILGCALGLLLGILLSSVGFLVTGLQPAPETYATLFQWPEIMTIDGIALLWLTLLPLVTAAAGARSGRKLGSQLEALTMQWFW
jgi:hypothetical protein